jgi:hypothetical protein
VVRVGDRGKTLTALRPQGTVRIDGNRHSAWCAEGFIEPDCEIVVVAGSLQGLVVRKVEPGQVLRLPDQGKVVASSFGEVVRRQGQQEDAERQEWEAQLPHWRRRRRAYTIKRGAVLGTLIAAGGFAPLWGHREQTGPAWWLGLLATAAVGLLWGIGVFWCLDRLLQKYLAVDLYRLSGRSYDGMVFVNAILILLIAASGACLSIPKLGLGSGLAIALVTTVTLLVLLPPILSSLMGSDD